MGMQSVATYRHRLGKVQWRDLVGMRPRDGLIECLHPLP